MPALTLVSTIACPVCGPQSTETMPSDACQYVHECPGCSASSTPAFNHLSIIFRTTPAILFKLQSDEWRRTSNLLRVTLEDPERPPIERLRAVVRAFIRSECEEAAMRVALNDAAPLYRDAPEAGEARRSGDRAMEAFMREALPEAVESTRAPAASLVTMTLSQVGKRFSESPRGPAEIEAYADAMADMFCAYLNTLAPGGTL